MAAKSKTTPAVDGKKKGQTARGKKGASKASKRRKTPRTAEEALMIAWNETYAKRDRFIKMWENK